MTSLIERDSEPVQSSAPAARPVTPAGIIAARLAALVQRLDSSDVDPAVAAEIRAVTELAVGLDPYVESMTTPESAALHALAGRTRAHDWSDRSDTAVFLEQEMLSGHVEGQLLKMLVHVSMAAQVLEIGMFTGYSALAMAEALPPDGRVVACEIDPAAAAVALESFAESADGARIEIYLGPAQQTLSTLADDGEVFDLIFIDADKPGYSGYVDAVLEHDLLAPHGLICVDNTLMQGEPWSSAVSSHNGHEIDAFNRRVAADPRVEQVVLPVRDGVTLIRRVR